MARPALKRTRTPTARDTRIEEAMAALLTHGSRRKAAEVCGVPKSTIDRWAASEEGQALLSKQSVAEGEPRAARIWGIVDTLLARLEKAIEADEIPPTALAVNIGILCDKAKQMVSGTKQDGAGDVVVEVFGGRFEGPGSAASGAGARVTVKGGGGA